MKVLVTGGAGFIGSHIVEKLLSTDNEVLVFDNLSSGLKENIPSQVTLVNGDVRNLDDIKKVMKNGIDAVFHLAGQPSIVNSFADPRHDFDVNFIGTFNMMQAAVKYKVKRFLYASSMTVYGNPQHLPVKESDPCVPINYYGVAKYAAERFLHITAKKEKGFHVTSFRMFNVYGPRQSLTNPYQGVLAIFIGNVLRNEPITIYGDGKQGRDFVYVEDIADTWVTTLNNMNSFGGVYNIGFGKQTGIKTLAEAVVKACGKDPKSYEFIFKEKRPGDQQFVEAEITKAKADLHFTPKFSLDEGLLKTLSWAKLQK